MGQQRLPVRKIREVLRLKAEGFSDRQIGAAIGSVRSTVQECLRRAPGKWGNVRDHRSKTKYCPRKRGSSNTSTFQANDP